MSGIHKNSGTLDLEQVAEQSGLAIVLADGRCEPVDGANNNSMCRVLYSSAEFAPHCAEFCGRAFERANEAGQTVSYQCHAGLNCLAVPLKTNEADVAQSVVIVGRTFLKAADYRAAAERAATGDWRQFPSGEFFENVLLTGTINHLENLAVRLEKLSVEEKLELIDAGAKAANCPKTREKSETKSSDLTASIERFHREKSEKSAESAAMTEREKPEDVAAWRSLFGSLLTLEYEQACRAVLNFLRDRFDLKTVIWLEREENRLEKILTTGEMRLENVQINVSADDKRLLAAARFRSNCARARKRAPMIFLRKFICFRFPSATKFAAHLPSAVRLMKTTKSESHIFVVRSLRRWKFYDCAGKLRGAIGCVGAWKNLTPV